MFRDKDFLVKHGFLSNLRSDTIYVIGNLYDDVCKNRIIKESDYLELKEKFSDENKDSKIVKEDIFVKFDSIVKKMRETIGKDIKVERIPHQEKKEEAAPIIVYDYKPIESVKKIKETSVQEKYEFGYNLNNYLERGIYHRLCTVDWMDKSGIYGIFRGDKIIYIGKTRNFKQRLMNHKNKFLDENNDEKIYKVIRNYINLGYQINFCPIVIIEDLQMKHKKIINNDELNAMELALITALKPEGNVSGVTMPYIWD